MSEFLEMLASLPETRPENESPMDLDSIDHGLLLEDDLDAFEFIVESPYAAQTPPRPKPRARRPKPRRPQNDTMKHMCFCGSDTCKKPYSRRPTHARVLEQSSQLVRYVDGLKYKNVQLVIPAEIQKHIGHGSCTHVFDSLKLFVKFIQLELGWCPQTGRGYKCALPSAHQYRRARDIMLGIGLSVDFYVYSWVPSFHQRFVSACGGLTILQTVAMRFFKLSDLRLLYGPTDPSEV